MAYEDILKELTLTDDRFIVMTAENRAAIRNLPKVLGNKFIDTGITEQALIGAAAGLALCGRIPVVHALATFLTLRAFEFIRTDVGIANLPVKIVGGVPGFLSEANGPTHQAIEDVSLMRGIPPVNVYCPADEEDMLIGLKEVLLSPSPFYIRYNNLKPAIQHNENFQIGKAEVISEGTDITLLVYGTLLAQAVKAKDILEGKGLSVRLINLRTVKPIDEEAILKAARETKLIVTLEDHFLIGGLYSILGEIFLKNRIMVETLPIALENRWFRPALLKDVLEYEGFTGEKIAERILVKKDKMKLAS
ncbi:MAG TPA: transketolase C-terminal domain-containing protein [Ignavibacteriales bacterium]|nr:transketolase C-terminal domain-containing protein [Ignavibacteriales bacterium]